MTTITNGIITTYCESPLGWLKVSVNEHSVTEVLFCDTKEVPRNFYNPHDLPLLMKDCLQQLKEYFDGKRRSFDLPLLQNGTSFQQTVWSALCDIPYGATISYLELSRRLGNVKAIRAAASSNGKNRIAIIVPCHRVIGTNKELVGYAGGLNKKRWLLEHELTYTHGLQTLF